MVGFNILLVRDSHAYIGSMPKAKSINNIIMYNNIYHLKSSSLLYIWNIFLLVKVLVSSMQFLDTTLDSVKNVTNLVEICQYSHVQPSDILLHFGYIT